ncbi:MAG: hypothetical protein QHH09_02020 [Microgenomates group bacterium]|nr:hypothetical protein [Microgenomates group bacterium]
MKKLELNKLNNFLIITKESLSQLEKNDNTLNANIKYWIKKGDLIRIKKGRYILRSTFDRQDNKEAYLEYLANKIYQPSYLSCEYVLSKYNLLTEAVFGITSVTTKKTKTFKNNFGTFTYYSISPSLFLDYETKKFKDADILIAKKEKAVFDFLYLRFFREKLINEKIIEELRINWENLSKKEFNKLKRYGKISKNKKIIEVINLIKKIYYA